MRHVGNDIVDLQHARRTPRSRDVRFLKRVFFPEEEVFLQSDPEPETMLWALWTAKEAAYKALQKSQGEISSVPRHYKVKFSNHCPPDWTYPAPSGGRFLQGSVEAPSGTIIIETQITPKFAHSLATAELCQRTIEDNPVTTLWKAKCLPRPNASPAYESSYVRRVLKKHLLRYLPEYELHDIEIMRSEGQRGLGPPFVRVKNNDVGIDISMSHDGAYVAYALSISQ